MVFYDGEKVVALNRKTGNEALDVRPVLRKTPFPTGYGPTLVVQQTTWSCCRSSISR